MPPYTPILATLGYIFDQPNDRLLMIHREGRADDHHLGKYNGLGGKLERDEEIVAGMRREVREESGLFCESLRLAGTISWPGLGPAGEDWFGFIFRIDAVSGDLLERCAEGRLVWVPREDVLSLPLWEGDRHFLPLVFATPLRVFHGVMPYDGGKPQSWTYSLLD